MKNRNLIFFYFVGNTNWNAIRGDCSIFELLSLELVSNFIMVGRDHLEAAVCGAANRRYGT
jgi:hypothetical protein